MRICAPSQNARGNQCVRVPGTTVAHDEAMRRAITCSLNIAATVALTFVLAGQAVAQDTKAGVVQNAQAAVEPSTRHTAIEQEETAKVTHLQPPVRRKVDPIFERIDRTLQGYQPRRHLFLENAYSGGGFAIGAGYASYVSAYNYIDTRASYSITNYKRAEAEFVAPRIFKRRGQLSVLGGWREATQVAFYGIGPDTSTTARTNYLFHQPYGSARLKFRPTRRVLMLGGGIEVTRWSQESGEGTFPSVETRYTPASLPGLGADVTYVHTQGTVALDSRPASGYTRRGAYLSATLHDYRDRSDAFGFQMAEYEGIAHVPILRETWVLSVRGRVQNVREKSGQQIPFFMLPSLGGGSSLRAYGSWRFRDQNSLLMQAEWRVMVNRYSDLAFFYDTGKVAARLSDLDFKSLQDDFGVGFRIHGPFVTPFRVDFSTGRESRLSVSFSASAVF